MVIFFIQRADEEQITQGDTLDDGIGVTKAVKQEVTLNQTEVEIVTDSPLMKRKVASLLNRQQKY